MASPQDHTEQDGAYRVLARKYRPQSFEDLIGQDAMVKTLSNAFASGRIAHGFIMTGVRGVGKTTTARIIAKGLNCVGEGRDGPTIHPCGTCEPCKAIAESRHVDVLEMDAASRTGIGDIREIIESVRYRPAECRFKVYIIDEVHMLSNAAFNGLLKTLEEPPPHVKFIFATTEIRKVPVTVLSRCQRFDLRRVEPAPMMDYLGKIAAQEGAEAAEDALALIARASEGSVRDAVSLLDQALAHGTPGEDGRSHIAAEAVRDMLGLADRSRVIDLFDAVMKGEMAEALEELRAQYETGADPIMVLNDLLEVVHWLTRINVVPSSADDPATPPGDRDRGRTMASELPMSVLTRAWQILLKGLGEATNAPNPLSAAEMVLIRLGYAATLKTPDDLLRMLEGGDAPASSAPMPHGGGGSAGGPRASAQARGGAAPAPVSAVAQNPSPAPNAPPTMALVSERSAPQAERAEVPGHAIYEEKTYPLTQFEHLVELAHARREVRFELALRNFVHPVSFAPGRITFRPTRDAPQDLSNQIVAKLKDWTGHRWGVLVSKEQGAPTLRERDDAEAAAEREKLRQHPLVAAAFNMFPGGELGARKTMTPEADSVAFDDPLDDDDDDDF